jgi:hypothetical protein
MSPKAGNQSNLEDIIADIGEGWDVLFEIQVFWAGAPRVAFLRGKV